ncbi:sensor histidine kinase, partial [Amycolatopsis sp. SID8362]|nr:sensor histidine kinase [Amycolatopsis sp. SID8362]NED38593.1 sensor histidine kinase [Amycolatopsis sp. SID8362]
MSRARIVDGVIAAGVAVALLSAGLSADRPPSLLGYAALVAGGLALAARRRAPVAVLVATAACALVYQAAGFEVPVVAYLFAVYAAVRAGHRVAAVVASVAMLGAVPLTLLASGLHDASEAFTQSRD